MDFDWQCHPEAEGWLYEQLTYFQKRAPALVHLEKELLEKTSTRLFDWIDHFIVDEAPPASLGFVLETAEAYTHPGAKLPSVLVRKNGAGIALKVESIAHFLMVRGVQKPIEGTPCSPYRRCTVLEEGGVSLQVVERRGTREMEPIDCSDTYLAHYTTFLERWQSRPRHLQDEERALEHAQTLAEEMVAALGQPIAAWIVLEAERAYWEVRNTAAQLQKMRQDRLGLGWANHDHHTFRSSRGHFVSLVRLFETLGFHCREQFHAGEQAGWGAQVMESTETGLILFLDLDLTPDELAIDFAHTPLPPQTALATVGLWCALHGDSILHSGMHHLEAQFQFDRLREDLHHLGIAMMDPFSNFPYLKQAFTKAEQWHVPPHRLDTLLAQGSITEAQAVHFRTHGALGSHLENLQRNAGYKGFNKNNVSLIMQRTDPRRA